MISKPKPPEQVATPTRADAGVITAGSREPDLGYGVITNSKTGKLQPRAQTGRTVTTGGTMGSAT
jgi:hypothetical protein